MKLMGEQAYIWCHRAVAYSICRHKIHSGRTCGCEATTLTISMSARSAASRTPACARSHSKRALNSDLCKPGSTRRLGHSGAEQSLHPGAPGAEAAPGLRNNACQQAKLYPGRLSLCAEEAARLGRSSNCTEHGYHRWTLHAP